MRRRGPAQFAPGANVAACNYFSREQVRPSHSLWSWELETDRFTSSSCQTNTQARNYCTFVGFKARIIHPSITPFPVLRSRHVGIRGPARPRESGETGKPPYAPTRSCPQSPWWTRMGAVTSRYLVPVISMASRKWTRTSREQAWSAGGCAPIMCIVPQHHPGLQRPRLSD